MSKFIKFTPLWRGKKNRGFSLLETLVAISIFTVSLLGIMSVLATSISDTTYAKQKMVATYLAQEGIEYIRNMRDTFVLYDTTPPPPSPAQHGWDAFNDNLLSNSCRRDKNPNGCWFGDLPDTAYAYPSQPMTLIPLSFCNDSICSAHPLLYHASTGKYDYVSSGVASGFTRQIKAEVVSSDETKITSAVYWKQGSGNYNVTFSENLFNWIQ
ncbi:MAG TPA: prepilin-type N-terminal cleavage/methylation domain-containing protein [Candidatus Paceibacterota bacterium]|nr:prepilin-type N-terminal cleavage/methylation domain-containing protein [Candidatus Paceibacterota bacterium]